jgi:hypothetical protein
MYLVSSLWAYLALLTLCANSVLSQNTCRSNCTIVGAPHGYVVEWFAIDVSTTITAATVVQIVNTDLDTTRFSTIHNQLPSGYQLPTNTNEQGTHTELVTYIRHGEVSITEL